MKGLKLLVIGAIIGASGWWFFSESDHDKENPSLLFDRRWVDQPKPQNPRVFKHALLVAKRLSHGIVHRRSKYRLEAERFTYKRIKENELEISLLQEDKKAKIQFTIKSCKNNDFDLCLTLDKHPWNGPTRFYGKRTKKRTISHETLDLLTSRD